MKRIIFILALLCFSGCINEKIEGVDLMVGDPIPEFSVVMNDGTVVSDASLKGNISCVVFFHTTCPDCQQTLPVIQQIYDEYLSKGVKFALISREQTSDEIDIYWQENSLNMPFSAQSDRTVYNLFAISRIPRVYICDKDGIIRNIFTDDPIPDHESLDNVLSSFTDSIFLR